ncbi:MAG: DNA gyrase C-terminal beta-propeller domain-containing protein, partial [Candidatus Brocadiales bacterium]
GGQGVININTEKAGKVVGLVPVKEEDELMLLTVGGKAIRTAVNAIPVIGRNTRGVRLISLEEGDRLASVARITEESTASQKEASPEAATPLPEEEEEEPPEASAGEPPPSEEEDY